MLVVSSARTRLTEHILHSSRYSDWYFTNMQFLWQTLIKNSVTPGFRAGHEKRTSRWSGFLITTRYIKTRLVTFKIASYLFISILSFCYTRKEEKRKKGKNLSYFNKHIYEIKTHKKLKLNFFFSFSFFLFFSYLFLSLFLIAQDTIRKMSANMAFANWRQTHTQKHPFCTWSISQR